MKAFSLIAMAFSLSIKRNNSPESTDMMPLGVSEDWDKSDFVQQFQVSQIWNKLCKKHSDTKSMFEELMDDEVLNEIDEENALSNMVGKYHYHDYSDYVWTNKTKPSFGDLVQVNKADLAPKTHQCGQPSDSFINSNSQRKSKVEQNRLNHDIARVVELTWTSTTHAVFLIENGRLNLDHDDNLLINRAHI